MKTMIKLITIICLCSSMVFTTLAQEYPLDPLIACEDNPVLSHGEPGAVWDSACVFLPHIFYENDTFYLFYTGSIEPYYEPSSIGYAVSDDGMRFTKHAGPIFGPDGSGFDAHAVSLSIVIKQNSEYIMYYQGKAGATFGPGKMIGRATADNINGPWSSLDIPVLQPGGGNQWDYRWVMPNSVIEVDSGYLMYFQGIDFWPDGTGQIGLAFSPDGIFWEKYDDPTTTSLLYAVSDPVLKVGEAGNWDDESIWGCSVIKLENGFEMFYAGIGFNGLAIGFATSQDGIHWEKNTTWPLYYPSDDPYAVSQGYPILEFPSALINGDDSSYYVYYDYGALFGEIGLATTDFYTRIPLRPISSSRDIQLYPNPCSGTTCLRYLIYDIGYLISDLYDISGRKIRELVNGEMMPGTYEVEVDVSDLPAGVYFIRVQAGDDVAVQKLLVVE